MPFSSHERTRRVQRPENCTTRRLEKRFTLLVATPQIAKQLGDSRDHGTGQHPRWHLASASWHERQVKKSWSGVPTCLGQNATDARPPESRTNDDATDNLACVS